VLDATTDHEFTLDEIREVARSQPAAIEGLRGDVRTLVVPGHDRGATDLELTDLTVSQHSAIVGVDDANVEARDRTAEPSQFLGTVASGFGRCGIAFGFEDPLIDDVGAESATRLREGSGNRDFGHTKRRENSVGSKS